MRLGLALALGLGMILSVPVPASAATLDEMACPTEQARIVVIGDSLADGLWAAMNRAFARCSTLDVVRLTAVSDGLVRTTAEEWLGRYAEATNSLIDTRKSDIVLVQLGTNDLAALRVGSSRESFGSEAWFSAYRQQAQTLAGGLMARAAGVVWFGLPIVGQDSADENYRSLSEVQGAAARAAGAQFVDIWEMSKFGGEAFSLNGEVDGRLQQMRSTDRVHFTTRGYDRVAAVIENELHRFLVARDRAAAMNDALLQ